MDLALDSGVKPAEISEIITQLAFYSGWPNAMTAVAAAKTAFAKHNIGADQLPAASPALVPLDENAEKKRAAGVEQQFGKVAPVLVQFTSDILFRNLWLRPDLPRDRSLATVSALIACGHAAQIPFHLNKAMDNGLTETEAAEVITQLAFYAGWPNAFSALPVAREVFEKRGQKNMDIKRVGSQASAKGSSEWFTGTVRIDPLFQAPDPALVQGASVTFEPGARTAWHTHPLGQTLIVTSGCGWVQHDGGLVEEVRPGDVVWFSPGEKHWQGATATTAMTHIAIQEKRDGKAVDWMEQVSGEQYRS